MHTRVFTPKFKAQQKTAIQNKKSLASQNIQYLQELLQTLLGVKQSLEYYLQQYPNIGHYRENLAMVNLHIANLQNLIISMRITKKPS